MIYQATLRRELLQSFGFEWEPVDPHTGMAELAGVDRDTITAWSRRSTQLRDWATHHLQLVDQQASASRDDANANEPGLLATGSKFFPGPISISRRAVQQLPGKGKGKPG